MLTRQGARPVRGHDAVRARLAHGNPGGVGADDAGDGGQAAVRRAHLGRGPARRRLGKRTFELRLPLQHSLRPADAYGDFLAELAALGPTPQRLAAVYDVVLPALAAR